MESFDLTNTNEFIKSNEKISDLTKEDEEHNIYFITLIPKEIEGENKNEVSLDKLNFITDVEPVIIYEKKISKEDGSVLIHRILKFKMKKEEIDLEKKGEKNSYTFKYIIENDVYTISFDAKKKHFIYDINLIKEDYYFKDIVPLNISQDIIPHYNKLEIFLEALKKNNELNKLEQLYDEAIDLYRKEKKFNLLIFLFLRIYDDINLSEKLLHKLLAAFKEKKGIENPKVDVNLLRNLDTFYQIYSNKEFVTKNKCEPIAYYGIIICYLYYYDTNDNYFSKIINELYKENNNVLYEILIMFHSYFIKPLNNDLDFFINFIEYVLENKDKEAFKKALDYIKDIVTFISVINAHKEKIVEKFIDFEPININPELKLIKKKDLKNKKNELDKIIELVNKIFDYSKTNNKLLLKMTDEFWSNMVSQYNKPDLENIYNCYNLRNLFKSYRKVIKKILEEYNKNNNKGKDYKKNKNTENEEKKSDKKDKNKDKDGKKDIKDDKSKEKKDKHKDKDEKKIDLKDILESILKDIEIYYKRDEFTFELNRNIKDFLSKNNLTNSQKLGLIEQYNPYFNIKEEDDEEKYSRNRDVTILDCIDFDKKDERFIDSFHKLDFERIFRKNISEFLNRIVSKIKSISNFGIVLDLIRIDSIEDNTKKEYFRLLKNKYEEYVKTEIESIKDEKELNYAIKILAKFVSVVYLFEGNITFLEERISQLDENIKSLVYGELMKTYKGKEYNMMKEYIYKLFLKKIDNIENIIKLIDSLTEPEDKKKFTEELVKKCKFEKKDFYSNDKNKNIELLCNLNEKGKLDKKYCKEIIGVLDDIYNDLQNNLFTKKELEEFLGGDDNSEKVIKKLGLIKIVINRYEPKDKYDTLNKKIKVMSDTINDLKEIKESFSIFHNSTKKTLIQKIINTINDIEKSQIYEYDTKKIQDSIKEILDNKKLSKDINNVKTLLIFRIIFDNTPNQEKDKRFYKAQEQLNKIKQLFKDGIDIEVIYKQNEKIFNKIKDELTKKELKSKEFIDQMIKNLEIPEKYREDLEIMFKSKKYEMDIKSIKFFFDIFSKNTFKFLKKNDELDFSKMSLNKLKNILKNLKDKKIYDYKYHEKYYDIFTSFYDKKEAIDFLFEKIDVDITYLIDRIDPTKRRLTIKNIEDTIEYLKDLKKIVNKNEEDILKEIKNFDVEKFVSYSKIYEAIIELDRNYNDNDDENIFKIVDKIIEKACFIFKQDEEDFFYTVNGKNITINLEYLVHIKNQISIQSKKTNSDGEGKDKEKKEVKKKEQFDTKCDKLLFYKELVNNLEAIYEKMDILRIKGCNLPILINIKVGYPNIIYKLDQDESDFDCIIYFY